MGDADIIDICASWQTGTPLGNDRFKEEIEAVLGKKVGQSKRGRPQPFKHWLDQKIFDVFEGYVLGTLQLLAAAFFVWLLIKDCKSDEGGGSEMS